MMGIEEEKGLELPLLPGQIGPRIRNHAEAVLKEHPDEMERVYGLIRFISDTMQKEGLLALEDAVRKFADFDAPFCEFLPDYIMALVDGTESDLLAEMMANDFEIRGPDECRNLFQVCVSHYQWLNFSQSVREEKQKL